MEATNDLIEHSLIFPGNIGNIGNTSDISSNEANLAETELYPNKDSGDGNKWEHDNSAIDLVPEDPPPIPDRLKVISVDGKKITVSDQWTYRNGKGEVVGYIQRFDVSPTRKEFRPLTLQPTKNGMEWKHKAPDEPRPLYGLDRLFANPEAEVIVCEGEKAADAAARLFPDRVAVTSMNGAKSPEKSDWSVLAGRKIFLWRDYDIAGEEYVISVERLASAAGAVLVGAIRPEWFLNKGIELGIKRDDLSIGWDAADTEQDGFTANNIRIFLGQENPAENNLLFVQPAIDPVKIIFEGEHVNNDVEDAATKKKHAQTRELFKNSEFAVIEFCKGYKNGVYWQEPFSADDTPKSPIFLCSPMTVIAETRDAGQSNWGRLIHWKDNDGHAHNWACPMEMLAASDNAEFRRELVRNGLIITTNNKGTQKLVDYVMSYPPKSESRVRCVTKTGWHGEQYVLSNAVFGEESGETLIYQGVTNGDFSSAGELKDWKREVATRAVGNSRMIFAISTAFAGPLVDMANESGGGFQFTGETSKGKTSTIIDPAASVCGHPDQFAKKWRTTSNGLEAICLSRNHSTLILDDLGQSDAKECGQSAYLIANGQGKLRMQKEGGNRPLTTWKTLILSSGEVDITQHMAEAGKVAKGGQIARLPSIPADAGAGMFSLEQLHDQADGRHFSDTMKAVTREYYGTAITEFLEKLTEPTAHGEVTGSIRDGIMEIIKLMEIQGDAAPEVGRVAARFALVGFSGELATSFGVTGWAKGEAVRAAIRCFNDWLSDSDGAIGSDNKVLFSQVSAFLQAHGPSRFPPHDISKESLSRFQNKAGFSFKNGENVSYWVESGSFNGDLCKGFNPTAAAKSLINAGWLEPGGDGRYQQKHRISAIGGNGLRFYVLTHKALGGEL